VIEMRLFPLRIEQATTCSLKIWFDLVRANCIGAHPERSCREFAFFASGNAFQFNDRQMPLSLVEANIQGQFCAGTPPHQSPRFGTRRTTWPPRANFEARAAIGGKRPVVRLVRCLAARPRMRPRVIVPCHGRQEFGHECLSPIRRIR
jgi:hypothetical protein